MDELVFPPSPNWYLHKIICAGSDGCVVYGCLSNGITILIPCDETTSSALFQVKTIRPAHKLRITCIDLCPNWKDSRLFISAADDGFVKLWNAATFSFNIANNVHFGTKETVVGASFITPENVVSVGNNGNLVTWNIKNNTVKVDSTILKTYKPLCVSGCSNKPGTVAIGTKKGVVLVLSVLERNEILFKSHGHDTEITSLSWCPTATCEPLVDILYKKQLKADKFKNVVEKNNCDKTTQSKEEIKEVEKPAVQGTEHKNSDILQHDNLIDSNNQLIKNVMDESDIFDVYNDNSIVEFGHPKVVRDRSHSKLENVSATETINNEPLSVNDSNKSLIDNSLLEAMNAVSLKEQEIKNDFLEECEKVKDLINPETCKQIDTSQLNESTDSADRTSNNVMDESDIFDVYKDHSLNEFGHSKFVRHPPVSENKDDIFHSDLDESTNADEKDKTSVNNSLSEAMDAVSLQEPGMKNDYLEECKKLKEMINNPAKFRNKNASRKGYFANESSSFGSDNDPDIEESFTENEKLSSTLNDITHDDSDIFDVYKEPSFYEFGHSKFMANSSVIDTDDCNKSPIKPINNFLDECEKLKKDLLDVSIKEEDEEVVSKNENVPKEEILLSSVTVADDCNKSPIKPINNFLDECEKLKKDLLDISIKEKDEEVVSKNKNVPKEEILPLHIFLASSCKNGKVCIWSQTGSLVTSGNIKIGVETKGQRTPKAGHPWSTVYWSSKLTLLAAYKTPHLIHCNFQSVTLKSKFLKCTSIHNAHMRGLFSISATKIDTTEDDWRKPSDSIIWTAAQDRFLTAYSLDQRRIVARYTTFGGFVYDIAVSPIDPQRVAFAVGDGAVRVWERNPNFGDENGLGTIEHHWNGVQGKVLCVAWHPIKEQSLAFSTFEGRVGLIKSGSTNPVKLLPPGLPLGAFHLCWGPQNLLFACGGGELIVYNTSFMNNEAEKITVTTMDRKWNISTVCWNENYLSVGSAEGAIGLLNPKYPYDVLVTAYPQRKAIQTIAWHPMAVSTEDGISPYSHYIAIAASSSVFHVMSFTKNNAGSSLEVLDEFSLHSERVNGLTWSPHHNGRLLSVSSDCTIQIWDVLERCVLHTLSGHDESVLCAVWCPINMNCVISAGEDSTVRVWNISKHPPQELSNIKRKMRRKLKLALVVKENSETIATEEKSDEHVSNKMESKIEHDGVKNETDHISPLVQLAAVTKSKKTKNTFLNFLTKQMIASSKTLEGCNRIFNQLCGNPPEETIDFSDGYDYLALYGSWEDIIKIIDLECNKYEETHNWEGWVMVGILRGDLNVVLRKAADMRKLCPALLSLAPSVSHRFWKEMITRYGAQLQGNVEETTIPNLETHGVAWRGMVLLSVGFIDEACTVLAEGGFFAEAIFAARIRHADHLVQKTMDLWINDHVKKCNYVKAAECYIALGLLIDAALILGKSNDEDHLAFAAKLAKHGGNLPLAEGVVHRISMKS